jgi:ketosteroid isomerase-like protein
MRNCLLTLFLLSVSCFAMAQSKADGDEIYAILNRQNGDWNKGDVKSFMHGYWESDSLMFVGKAGVTYGYNKTYENYLKRYPDRASMGTLNFEFVNLTFPAKDVAFLVGKWHLTRPEKGDIGGHYTLLWKKMKGKWVIVCDHSS